MLDDDGGRCRDPIEIIERGRDDCLARWMGLQQARLEGCERDQVARVRHSARHRQAAPGTWLQAAVEQEAPEGSESAGQTLARLGRGGGRPEGAEDERHQDIRQQDADHAVAQHGQVGRGAVALENAEKEGERHLHAGIGEAFAAGCDPGAQGGDHGDQQAEITDIGHLREHIDDARARRSAPRSAAPPKRSVSLCKVSPSVPCATKKQVIKRGADARPIGAGVDDIGRHRRDRRLEREAHMLGIGKGIRHEQARRSCLVAFPDWPLAALAKVRSRAGQARVASPNDRTLDWRKRLPRRRSARPAGIAYGLASVAQQRRPAGLAGLGKPDPYLGERGWAAAAPPRKSVPRASRSASVARRRDRKSRSRSSARWRSSASSRASALARASGRLSSRLKHVGQRIKKTERRLPRQLCRIGAGQQVDQDGHDAPAASPPPRATARSASAPRDWE